MGSLGSFNKWTNRNLCLVDRTDVHNFNINVINYTYMACSPTGNTCCQHPLIRNNGRIHRIAFSSSCQRLPVEQIIPVTGSELITAAENHEIPNRWSLFGTVIENHEQPVCKTPPTTSPFGHDYIISDGVPIPRCQPIIAARAVSLPSIFAWKIKRINNVVWHFHKLHA